MAMSPRDRRVLIIFGVVAVAAAAVFFLFVSKGPKTAQAGSPGAARLNVNQPAPTPSATPAKKKQKQVLVFSGRDPFDPAQGGGSVAAAGASVSPPGSPSAGPGGGSSQVVGGKTVVLVSIFTQDGSPKAQVEVDGTVYTVGVGDSFDDGYRLVSISGSCANFTHSSTSFTLCESANK
jgi:hypothetical protein